MTRNLPPHREPWAVVAFGALVALSVWLGIVGLAHANESTTLRALQAMPRHSSDADEGETDRAERLGYIAGAIDGVARNRLERAVLILLVQREGVNAARFVDLDWDTCRNGVKGWCDSGRAYGLTQLHGTLRTETRAEQFAEALKRWRYHRQRCGGSLAGAFAGYGSGSSCKLTAQAVERAEIVRRMAGRL